MKIVFMVGQFPALSETFILNQITALIDRGHHVSILAERPSGEGRTHEDVDRYGLRAATSYESLPENFIARALRLAGRWRPTPPGWRALNIARFGLEAASLRLAWSVTAWGSAIDADIVHCHFGALGRKAVSLREAGALRGRIVTAFHGEDITNYPQQFRGNIYAPLFAHGDLFLPISPRWNDSLVALGCPPNRIRPHRMGIDLARFPPVRQPAGSGRPLRLLSIARLVEKKGIADALHAVARLDCPFEYVIAGDGPLRPALEAMAARLGVGGSVTFAGAQTHEQIAMQLCSADILVAPSVTAADGDIEGIPVSIMEAMASGLPVVSTLHSGIPELVAHGVSGFLVTEHDIGQLTHHLAQLAVDPTLRARMGAAGRAIVERDFDVAKLTQQLEATYRGLLCVGP